MSAAVNQRWQFKATIFGLVAAILVWQVIARSVAASLADTAPEVALWLDSSEPKALLNRADQKLAQERRKTSGEPVGSGDGADTIDAKTGRMPGFAKPELAIPKRKPNDSPAMAPGPPTETETKGSDQARNFAERAIVSDPLNARAFGILAELAGHDGDKTRATALSEAAVSRSLRESEAVYRLVLKNVEAQDFAKALYYADALLRTRPGAIVPVVQVLASLAETSEASGALKMLLVGNPPWRGLFFAHLHTRITDARTPLELLLNLKDSANPPTTAELRDYLEFLIRQNFFELAYYSWLQFLSAEQLASAGFLFNGRFETKPSGLPFDWIIQAGPGVTAEILARPGVEGRRGLYVAFGSGRGQFGGVSQVLMLVPGTYALKGRYKSDVAGRRGLRWRVACTAAKLVPIAETPMVLGANPVWKEFNLAFTVPTSDCRAQNLRLELDARSASEQLVSGSVWYDELTITRGEETLGGK